MATTSTPSILVTGATGQLGQALAALASSWPEADIVFADRTQLDLSQLDSITGFFSKQRFDLVINTAAYTAVDKAESEPDLAETINHLAPAEMARLLAEQDACLLQVSTDYVFDGTQSRPYHEDDACNPQSVYGHSKWRGEQAIIASGVRGAIVRTSWVYSRTGHNFVKTMLRLGRERDELRVVNDQVGGPTYATDLAAALLHMAREPLLHELHGDVFHHCNQGSTTWHDLAAAVFELADIDCNLIPITTAEYPTAARRPAYSLLDTHKIRESFALGIADWRDALARCLDTASIPSAIR